MTTKQEETDMSQYEISDEELLNTPIKILVANNLIEAACFASDRKVEKQEEENKEYMRLNPRKDSFGNPVLEKQEE